MSGLSHMLDEAAPASIPDIHGLEIPEYVGVYQAIKSVNQEKEIQVVEFLSAYANEGAARVAFGAGLVAAQVLGKRVLVVDASGGDDPTLAKLTAAIPTPLNVAGPDTLATALVRSRTAPIWLATLAARGNDKPGSTLPSNLEGIEAWFGALRSEFDLIIVASSPSSKSALGLVLSKMVDGVVLVVEAERTRAPVVQQLQANLHSVGSDPLGVVLTNRRYYLPRWLYRWL